MIHIIYLLYTWSRDIYCYDIYYYRGFLYAVSRKYDFYLRVSAEQVIHCSCNSKSFHWYNYCNALFIMLMSELWSEPLAERRAQFAGCRLKIKGEGNISNKDILSIVILSRSCRVANCLGLSWLNPFACMTGLVSPIFFLWRGIGQKLGAVLLSHSLQPA